jgi:hypothetical protein
MLAPFKRYIEALEVGMAPQMNNHGIQNNNQMAQAPSIAQALLVAQTMYANVPAGNAKDPKYIMLEKFGRTRSKFRGFVQQVNLLLRLHPSYYHDDFIQVPFICSLLSKNVLSWFAPILRKHSPILYHLKVYKYDKYCQGIILLSLPRLQFWCMEQNEPSLSTDLQPQKLNPFHLQVEDM